MKKFMNTYTIKTTHVDGRKSVCTVQAFTRENAVHRALMKAYNDGNTEAGEILIHDREGHLLEKVSSYPASKYAILQSCIEKPETYNWIN